MMTAVSRRARLIVRLVWLVWLAPWLAIVPRRLVAAVRPPTLSICGRRALGIDASQQAVDALLETCKAALQGRGCLLAAALRQWGSRAGARMGRLATERGPGMPSGLATASAAVKGMRGGGPGPGLRQGPERLQRRHLTPWLQAGRGHRRARAPKTAPLRPESAGDAEKHEEASVGSGLVRWARPRFDCRMRSRIRPRCSGANTIMYTNRTTCWRRTCPWA